MTLDEAIIHASEMAEDQDMKAGFETDNQAYAMSEAEREVYKMGAKEYRQRAEWLKELKQLRKQTSWIPVSEKLPEKNMRCLVAVGRFNFTEIATYSDLMGIIDHKIFYQGDVGHDNYKNITQYVKAWMSLPKIYDGE